MSIDDEQNINECMWAFLSCCYSLKTTSLGGKHQQEAK